MSDPSSVNQTRSRTSRTSGDLIQAPSDAALDRAVAFLGQGELVAVPTETVYGLAANAWDPDAVARIYSAKGRPSNNPLIVHVASVKRLSDAIAWPLQRDLQDQLEKIADLWPGPLTVVVPRNDRIPDIVTAGRDTVAVRIPAHPVALELLARCQFPLAAPSANRSRYVSPTTAQHVLDGLKDSVAMILDGGPCRLGVESTIVALDAEGPKLLRPGGVTVEELRQRLGDLECPPEHGETDGGLNSSRDALESPGRMRQHYCPNTALRLIDPRRPPTVGPGVGRIAFEPIDSDLARQYQAVEVLSSDGDLQQVARQLFAALRKLDRLGLDEIHCDTCTEAGLGLAIMDRLRRAAASR